MSARLSHVFPQFAGRSLLSIPTLCQHDCVATYGRHTATITLNNRVILTGTYDTDCRAWIHAIPPPPVHPIASTHNVITHRNEADRVRWYHAAFACPTIPTFKTAISKGLINIPGLTTKMLERNEPNPPAMHEGHLKRSRAGIRSTRSKPTTTISSTTDDDALFASDPQAVAGLTMSIVTPAELTQPMRIHADATGRFPIPSTNGTLYYLVTYDEASNYIHAEPMTDRTNSSYEKAFRATLSIFERRGSLPPILRVDNELSGTLVDVVQKKFNLTVERAPPHNHRTLRAERAIQTWKNHFISTLCTVPATFPLTEHDRLVPYAVLTLNLLRESRSQPGVSAWQHIHGPINWNGCIFAPPALEVIAYETKEQRGTWGPHGQHAFYLGPQLSSYRSHRVYVSNTHRERITDTVAWLPEPYRLPGSEPLEIVATAIHDLINVISAAQSFPPTIQASINTLLPLLRPQLEELQRIFAPPTIPRTETAPDLLPLTPYVAPPPTTAPEQRVAPLVTPTPQQRVPETVQTTPAPILPPTPNIRHRTFHHPGRKKKPQLSKPEKTPTLVATTTPQPRIRQPNRRYAQQVTTLIFEKGKHDPLHTAFPTLNSLQQLQHPPTIPIVAAATPIDRAKYTTPAVNSTSNDILPSYRLLRQGPDGARWERAGDSAIFKLVDDTGTMHFIPYDHTVSYCYYKPVCKMKKGDDGVAQPHVRGTAADTKSTYDGPTAANTADLSTVKLLLNSVVSTPNAKFCSADVKDYYLGTPMAVAAYMVISLKQLSTTVIDKYNLRSLSHNNNVMVKITKGMYGLAQAGRLAQDRLIPHLSKHGYEQCREVPMLFRHATRPIAFTLIVDDFGIKYTNLADADHLFAALRELYVITTDMSGEQYIGLHINHNRIKHTITISIPEYVNKAIKRFAPELLGTKGRHAPMRYHPFVYGPHATATPTEDLSPPLDEVKKKRLQGIIGTFLYYARALDITAAFPTAKLASLPHTQHTEELAYHFLGYMAAHPDAHVTFKRSDMQHNCHSDASFHGETLARSRAAGLHFLGHFDPATDTTPNGCVEYLTTIIDVVVASATEAELAAIFLNAQIAVSLRHALTFLGHPQGPSLIVSDNLVGVNILNGTAKSKRSRSMDLRFFWVKDRISQQQFKLSWAPGANNLADYLTKIHPAKDYIALRPTFVSDPTSRDTRQPIERVC